MSACPHCGKPIPTAVGRGHCPHCRQSQATVASRWFLARNKKKHGPYSWEQLQSLARRGNIGPDDMLLQEGAQTWQRAADIPGLLAAPAPAAKQQARPSTVLLAAIFGGATAVLVLTVCIIVGVILLGRSGANSKQASRDRSEIEKKTPPNDPPVKTDAVPKKNDDGPKTNPPEKKNPPEPVVDGPRAEQLVRDLNRLRQYAGLGHVAVDDELSRGCSAHARYLARNLDAAKDGAALNAEDASKPGYSAEGERAGQNSLIALADPAIALERWMGRMAGRMALLNAEMRFVGIGVAQADGGRWIVVLDSLRGRGDPIIVYPAPKQTDVPLSFGVGPEVPDNVPAGFPVTITFPLKRQVAAGNIELADAKGNAVPAWLSNPEKPAPYGKDNDQKKARLRQRNTVVLIPKTMLQPATTYHAKASAQLDGKPWRLDWSFTTGDSTDSKGDRAREALAKVNAYRAHAGLNPVTLDNHLTEACLKHARYLVSNEGHPALEGLKAHDEDLTLPGATPEGKEAGLKSDISIGDFDPLDGIDAWMATLYHRVPILEPNLERIGFGCARGRRQAWVAVMNVQSGRSGGDRPFPVFYPADKQLDVPLNFPNGGEVPNPIPEDKTGKAGYPITAFFPRKAPLVNASGKLADAQGADVPCWFSSPENPANPKYVKHQGNTVCLIPNAPLKPNTTYEVQLGGQIAGRAWQKKWRFTTGDGGMTQASAKSAVLERINQYRATAGLSAVTGDDKLCRGCQLHAEYLTINALALAKSKFSPNDEDPLLPGFTDEGFAASRRSDVYTNAPTPIIQVDDMMSNFGRRISLLDPTLQRVGFGCVHDIGRGWRCALDVNSGRGDARVFVYPAPKQGDLPTASSDRIAPAKDRPGFPITVIFPKSTVPQNPQAILSDAAGKDVEVAISSAQNPLLEQQPANVIGVYPLAPLEPGRTYAVTVSAIVVGSEWRQTWQFTTRK